MMRGLRMSDVFDKAREARERYEEAGIEVMITIIDETMLITLVEGGEEDERD